MQSISVVIPAYNSARWLPETINSALAQSAPPLEIIVVDDGSTDDTSEVLEQFGGAIRHLRQRNLGIAAARNAGIRAAKGALIAFLDADDVWFPSILERQQEASARTDAGVMHTNWQNWDSKTGRKWPAEGSMHIFNGDCYRQFFWNVPGSTASAFMVRKECFDKVGLFDETIPGGCGEDLEMWTRLARSYRFSYIDDPLLLRRRHDSNTSRNYGRMQEGYFWAREKALAADHQMRIEIGEREIRAHLGLAALNAGYGYSEAEPRNASRCFVHAFRKRYRPMRSLALAAVSYLRSIG